MRLVGNTFEQARQCVDGIPREKRPASNGKLDAVIVGAGPAGLSATINAKVHGLKTITIEKEPNLGGTVQVEAQIHNIKYLRYSHFDLTEALRKVLAPFSVFSASAYPRLVACFEPASKRILARGFQICTRGGSKP